jgi:hypothetical protein
LILLGILAVVLLVGGGMMALWMSADPDRDSAELRKQETEALTNYLHAIERIRDALNGGQGAEEVLQHITAATRLDSKEFREIREASNPRRERQRAILTDLTSALNSYRAAAAGMAKGTDAATIRTQRESGDSFLQKAAEQMARERS